MAEGRPARLQNSLEKIAGRWWLALLFVLLFFIPPLTAKPVDPRDAPQLIVAVFSQAIIYARPALFPLFKLLPMLCLVLLLIFKNKAAPLFTLYAAVNLLLAAVGENIAVTAEYGRVILIANIAMTLPVALAWLLECLARRGDYARPRLGQAVWLCMPLALLAFWFPVDLRTLRPDFNPLYLLTSEAGLTFCQMVPVYLTVLLLYYPLVNRVTLWATAWVGFVIGLLGLQFMFNGRTVWMGVLHLPLLLISAYALLRTRRKDMAREIPAHAIPGKA